MIAVPVVMPYTDGGNLRPKGLLRLEGDRVIVEYQLFDAMWGKEKSDVTEVILGLHQISNVHFEPGIFGDVISIQGRSMKALAEIPAAIQGRAILKTRRRDRGDAKDFVAELKLKLSERMLHE